MISRSFCILFALALFVVAVPARAAMQVLSTNHYEIHTDLEPKLSADLAQRLDAMYDEYSRRLSNFGSDDGKVSQVYLFRDQAEYGRFTGNRLENSGGVFLPQRGILAAFLDPQGRDPLRRTLQHEAFHQFAHACIGDNLPPWLNEGLAVLFEEGIWTGQHFELGEIPPRRVRQLRADQAGHRLTEFREFMTISNDRWSDNLIREPSLGAAQYNQAWAMVHFLVFSGDPGKPPKYRARFLNMLKLIHEGKDAPSAFRAALSSNVDGFQQRFEEWIAQLQPTPKASMIERQEVLGDLLIELAKTGKKFDRMSDFRADIAQGNYRLRYTKGEVRWTAEPDVTKFFAAPDGRQLRDDEFFFESRSQSPLSDMVYRGPGPLKLRTRFYDMGDNVHHEVLVEGTQ